MYLKFLDINYSNTSSSLCCSIYLKFQITTRLYHNYGILSGKGFSLSYLVNEKEE
jgi:hypothetical protein